MPEEGWILEKGATKLTKKVLKGPDPNIIGAKIASERNGEEGKDRTKYGPIADQWHSAPGTSHISRFINYINQEQEGWVIGVTFKIGKSGGETREYKYYFATAEDADAIFNALKNSPHPYGEVLYPRVIKAKVPYK
jgi:hypothetical protein